MANKYTLSGTRRFEFIDALRGLAALGVLLVHSIQHCGSIHALIPGITSSGLRGVQLFYILSALTLFLSLEERYKKDKYPFISFFVRRFFRIAPLFYVVIIINFIIKGYSARYWAPEGISNFDFFSAFIFLNAWIPNAITSVVEGGWSVAIEMNFYALIPFLYKKIKGINSALSLTLISYIFLALILSGLLYSFSSLIVSKDTLYLYKDYFHTFWLPAEFFVFMTGICLFFLLKQELISEAEENNLNSVFLKHLRTYIWQYYLFVSCFIATLVIYGISSKFLWTCSFSLLIILLSLKPVKVIVNPFTILIGKFSYSIYLLHFFVLGYIDKILINLPFINKLMGDSTIFISMFKVGYIFTVALSGVLIISYITYYIIEKNGIRLAKQITVSLNK
ncbi:MAG: acyltransferase family protein [Heteroscytonema crispum UTEX LB 1556]